MGTDFVKVNGKDFEVNGKKLVLRGYGLGNILNIEHFMIGLPGTESQIRAAMEEAYGVKNAKLFWEKYFECCIGEKDFEFLKKIGVNAVRIPFNYHHFESDQSPYTYMNEVFVHIDRILKLCEKYGIYGILDLHAAAGGQNPDWHSDNAIGEPLFWEYADFRNRTIALWKFIAEHYKDNPWIAAYDLINEPVCHRNDASQLINDFYDKLIRAIREVDNNHVLFLEGNIYSRDFTMFKPCEDPNTAYTFHYYPFFNLSDLSKENTVEKVKYLLYNEITLKYMQDVLKRPIWCGETGIPLNTDFKELCIEINKNMLDVLEEQGISWSIWTYKDARGMGTLHPGAESPWMEFSRKAKKDWDFWSEFSIAPELSDKLIREFEVEPTQKLSTSIKFRNLASRQLIIVERYKKLFSEIPFEELIKYPESFLFENCDVWEDVAESVRKYTLYD